MRAIVQDKYGFPAVLELAEIEHPAVKDDEVLVRVRAASANTYGWDIPASLRHLLRLMTVGLRKPRRSIPGLDFAGEVDAVGKNVKQFQPGDEVFGWCKGALVEYVSVSEDALKPVNLTIEESAVVPISGFTALQGLRDKGQLQPGQHVLVVGASGGVGTFAVQIAKAFGAEVTGVCSAGNLDMIRSIGADHAIDYTQEDFTHAEQGYDLILDMAGNRSLSDLRHVLAPKGTLVMVGGSGLAASNRSYSRALARWLRALVLSVFVPEKLCALIQTRSKEDLIALGGLIEAGQLKPVISADYPLSEAPETVRHFEDGHAQGRVVITI